jgi:hypothetical protein
MDDPGDQTMRAVTKHEFVFSLYLVSLSVVAMVPVGVFFGVGFLLLAPPRPAAPSADLVLPPQSVEAHEIPPSENRDTAASSSLGVPDKMAIATPDVPPNQEMPVLEATRMGTAPSRQPELPMPRASGSFAIARKHPGDVGLRYGDLMPALDRIRAAASMALQISISDTETRSKGWQTPASGHAQQRLTAKRR